ncbi:type II secretion system protein [Clostridium sp.]|uniref:type II secretion system protein n=1 Tax=Clostridium sp. TaxID=1506 RepID=UPI001A49BD99|nr:type II secretion system protein [Clostridium sp.]MBK5241295.1 type II secretion system protein [Clostridium sp.]
MLKSTSKKGFTLVEVICSLSIFSIIFISVMSFDITSSKMKKTIKITNNNVFIMETLKNNIIYSMTFEELEGLKTDNRVFINNENMTLAKIQKSLINVFSDEVLEEKPYIQLSFLKYELNVYSLRLCFYDNMQNDTPGLQCNFYKGNYK